VQSGAPRGFVVVGPGGRRPRAGRVPGSQVEIVCDAQTPTAALLAGVNTLAPGASIPLHFHDHEELQLVLSGTGVALDSRGSRHPIEPGTAVYCAAGPEAAHGFVNTGDAPLAIFYAYPTPGGRAPSLEWVAGAAGGGAGAARRTSRAW
jgi:quercetin dioxygenase-like cupin family protein